MSDATHTTTDQHAEKVETALVRGRRDSELLDGRDFFANQWDDADASLAALRARAAAADTLADALRTVSDFIASRHKEGDTEYQVVLVARPALAAYDAAKETT